MNTKKRMKILLSLAVVALLAMAITSAQAATMSSSPTAPKINGADVANYGIETGSDKWWAEDSTGAGSAKGQSFTIGDSPDILLYSITYQVTASQKAEPTKEYVIRVGTISGTTFNQIHSETATQDFFWAGGEYMTWTFETPVPLNANTQYGIDVGMTSSTSGWQSGIPYIAMTANVYDDGDRYTTGQNGVGTSTIVVDASRDRIFHIDMADPNAPSVDAGYDVATWFGEPVPMTPTVENNDPNDPVAPLTYLWTAEPSDIGLEVVISDPAVETPTVAINAIPVWFDVPVLNPSFEERETFDPFTEATDRYFQWSREYWRHFEVDNNGGPTRIWNPGVLGVDEMTQGVVDVAFGGNAPDGKYIGIVRTRYNDDEMSEIRPVRDWEALVQIVDDQDFVFDPDANYKLTVQVGRLPEGPGEGGSVNYLWDETSQGPVRGWYGYTVQLAVGGENVGGATYAGRVDGGTVIAEDANSLEVPVNGFVTSTIEYTAGSAASDFAGLPLQVRLCALENPEDHSMISYAAFDDVKLITDAAPANRSVTMTLVANNEGSAKPAVTGSMEIYVYETACEMTKAITPEARSETDLDDNCITDLRDFAILAAKWLDDYEADGPVPIQP